MRLGPYEMRPLAPLEHHPCTTCGRAVEAGQEYILDQRMLEDARHSHQWTYRLWHVDCMEIGLVASSSLIQ